jgi:hypothetical protein
LYASSHVARQQQQRHGASRAFSALDVIVFSLLLATSASSAGWAARLAIRQHVLRAGVGEYGCVAQSNAAAELELKEAEAMLAKRSTIDSRELLYSGGRLVINQVANLLPMISTAFSASAASFTRSNRRTEDSS